MALKEGKEPVAVERKTQCSRGDQCSFRHESNDRAQKPEHNVVTFCESFVLRGRSMSRKRSIRGKNLKGTCTRSPCECWHFPSVNFTKQERAVKPGISVCSRIIRLTNNRTKSRKTANISPKDVKIVSQMGCVSQDLELLDSQRGKQARGNPMQKVLEQVSGKRKDHRLEKHKSKILINGVPTL